MDFQSINEPYLRKQFKGDEEILLEMIILFQENMYKLLDGIRTSIEVQDAIQLRINAHTFKGIMRGFYADQSEKMAYALEKGATSANFSEATIILHKLEDHLMLFIYDLHRLKKSLNEQSI
ncbi:MAG: hypothetical protein K2Q18_05425 [Bdellovibrionales bacterium]|nr:hypothetical protein [Bdellovibrionales bacterium]